MSDEQTTPDEEEVATDIEEVPTDEDPGKDGDDSTAPEQRPADEPTHDDAA